MNKKTVVVPIHAVVGTKDLDTHTRLMALFPRMSWYHKGNTNLDFTEARDSE